MSGFDNSKVILIAGGLDRGNEFDELVPDITGLKKMVILGQSAERVKRAADKAGVAYVDATDIADATRKASELAEREMLFSSVLPMPAGICMLTLKYVEIFSSTL